MPFDLGDVVPLSISVYDSSTPAALANAATLVLTITLPDGTAVTPTVLNPPTTTGVYTFDYAAPVSGRYTVRWTSTNPQAAHADSFDVSPIAPLSLFSMVDAKEMLNLSSTTHDAELRSYVESVTGAIEFLVGPVVRQSVVERHDGGSYLVLRASPVISVTSIASILTSGTTYAPSACDIDGETGIVQRLDGESFIGPLRVTFVAGRAVVPAPIRDAARITLQHVWAVQRGAGGLPSVVAPEDGALRQSWEPTIPGFAYTMPNRALQLLAPYMRAPETG